MRTDCYSLSASHGRWAGCSALHEVHPLTQRHHINGATKEQHPRRPRAAPSIVKIMAQSVVPCVVQGPATRDRVSYQAGAQHPGRPAWPAAPHHQIFHRNNEKGKKKQWALGAGFQTPVHPVFKSVQNTHPLTMARFCPALNPDWGLPQNTGRNPVFEVLLPGP